MPYKKCKVCKSVFYARPDKENRGKYCSRECYRNDLSRKIRFHCQNCGKIVERPKWRFTVRPSQHRFCSIKCYSQHRMKHPDEYPNYQRRNKIRIAKILTKDVLKKEYIDKRMRMLDIATKYDTTYSLVQKRLQKYGFRASRSRYSLKNSEAHWQRTLNKRHNHTCQICGWNKDNCDIHHKVHRKDGGKWEENNLILVCPNCHRLLHKGKLKI